MYGQTTNHKNRTKSTNTSNTNTKKSWKSCFMHMTMTMTKIRHKLSVKKGSRDRPPVSSDQVTLPPPAGRLTSTGSRCPCHRAHQHLRRLHRQQQQQQPQPSRSLASTPCRMWPRTPCHTGSCPAPPPLPPPQPLLLLQPPPPHLAPPHRSVDALPRCPYQHRPPEPVPRGSQQLLRYPAQIPTSITIINTTSTHSSSRTPTLTCSRAHQPLQRRPALRQPQPLPQSRRAPPTPRCFRPPHAQQWSMASRSSSPTPAASRAASMLCASSPSHSLPAWPASASRPRRSTSTSQLPCATRSCARRWSSARSCASPTGSPRQSTRSKRSKPSSQRRGAASKGRLAPSTGRIA
eukprot:m.198388 g.198388  ORF g.198388 m.198388 type:complete len:349 (-) comp17675_c0_seq5:6535-7581(-)